MADLQEIHRHLSELLKLPTIPDYPPALNGIHLENQGEVRKLAVAVDACLPVIKSAVERGSDALLVHHGLFWTGLQAIQGPVYEKLKLAMDHNLGIYSAHIPLDVHETFGNNVLLGNALGFAGPGESFLPWKGILLGRAWETSMDRTELMQRVESATGTKPHLCPGGPETLGRVGIITGGAGTEVAAVAQEVDTFITGEGQHWTYTLAEELGVNLIYGGHYATETFGVKALGQYLSDRYSLEWEFIDHPTGL